MKPPKELSIFKNLFPQLIKLVSLDYANSTTPKNQKPDTSITTATDLKLDHLITQTIKDHFPTDHLLSEELYSSQNITTNRLWVIDPLCGTYNFALTIPFFTTNIALFQDQKPIFAFVLDYPNQTYYWSAQATAGVYQKTKKVNPVFKFYSQEVLNIDIGYIMTKPYHPAKQQAFTNIVRDFLSAKYEFVNLYSSLAYTYAALGKYGAFLLPSTKIWDIAPACYFTQQNHGVATELSGKPWSLTSTNILASIDKTLHQKLLKITQKHWQE